MNIKGFLFIIVVFSLLVGSVCATSVSGFKVDNSYINLCNEEYFSYYSNNDYTSGICIFKNENDDVYDNIQDTNVLNNVVHNDGKKYITPDNNLFLSKNPGHTANFNDTEQGTSGTIEVVNVDGNEYIIVVWSTNTTNVDTAKELSDFNKENNDLKPIPF